MIIGRMRHFVTVKYATQEANSFGERAATWAERGTAWASIEPLRGREYLLAQQVQAEIDTRIIIRYMADVVPTDRVYFGTRVFHIASVVNADERNITMELICKELI